jgi:hypothetical protein
MRGSKLIFDAHCPFGYLIALLHMAIREVGGGPAGDPEDSFRMKMSPVGWISFSGALLVCHLWKGNRT